VGRYCDRDRHCAAGAAVLKILFTHLYFCRTDAAENPVQVQVKENVGMPTY
jgi:hypothetical protein